MSQQQDDVVMGNLERAWNMFVTLTPTHPDDVDAFRQAIHQAQSVMAMRQLRRDDPKRWAHLPVLSIPR